MEPVRHITKITDLKSEEFLKIIDLALEVKKNPKQFANALEKKTLLMLFEKPSLRTRVSFETGMTQMGGHAIFYSITDSPLGEKESYHDTAMVLSRMVDCIMARVKQRVAIQELSRYSTIPIINGLDDFAHPCQMLADFLTIKEKFGKFEGLKLAYVGDCANNVTYDLMRTAALLGIEINVGGPEGEKYAMEEQVIKECEEICSKTGGKVTVMHDAKAAVEGVDIVYNDSWLSYHIPKSEAEERLKVFQSFQVNDELMKHAKPTAFFMNPLPAQREKEVTTSVIDGPQSIVFDEAENRLHAQKALLIWLLGDKK
eukprot:Anaeramoba_ignava/a101682_588.p1 GENE.a101682_588~~a101682_588.p1  ORF type:complete len:314 (-),score=104.57 a101682_588:61-1002(-)